MTGRVLWVSTHTDTKGGIASYVRAVRGTDLWRRWGIQHVSTHRNGSAAQKLVAFGGGVAIYLWRLAVRPPAIVHLHTASYGSFARKSVLLWLARARGVPVVLHVHGAEFQAFHDRLPRILRRYVRSTLESADSVVALGDTWAGRLTRIAPEAAVRVIPNAVEPGTAVVQPRRASEVQVLFLGEVSERKGTFTLLEAWSRLTRRHNGAVGRLVVAGDGDLEEARACVSRLAIHDSVDLAGWVQRERVSELLRASHVLVLASRDEGQPMAVLEAMAQGLCVVVSDAGGLPDLVDAECGVVVSPDDVDELTAALERVLDNPEERTRLGKAALRRVEERFDLAGIERALENLYRELVT